VWGELQPPPDHAAHGDGYRAAGHRPDVKSGGGPFAGKTVVRIGKGGTQRTVRHTGVEGGGLTFSHEGGCASDIFLSGHGCTVADNVRGRPWRVARWEWVGPSVLRPGGAGQPRADGVGRADGEGPLGPVRGRGVARGWGERLAGRDRGGRREGNRRPISFEVPIPTKWEGCGWRHNGEP